MADNKDILPGDRGVSLGRGNSGDIISCVINEITTNAIAKQNITKYVSITVVPGGTHDEPYVVPAAIETNKPILPILQGVKTDISTTATQLFTTSIQIHRAMTLKVRSIGTGKYIGIGNETGQEYRLIGVGATKDIDFVDNLTDLYVVTDNGNTSELEWIGA